MLRRRASLNLMLVPYPGAQSVPDKRRRRTHIAVEGVRRYHRGSARQTARAPVSSRSGSGAERRADFRRDPSGFEFHAWYALVAGRTPPA